MDRLSIVMCMCRRGLQGRTFRRVLFARVLPLACVLPIAHTPRPTVAIQMTMPEFADCICAGHGCRRLLSEPKAWQTISADKQESRRFYSTPQYCVLRAIWRRHARRRKWQLQLLKFKITFSKQCRAMQNLLV